VSYRPQALTHHYVISDGGRAGPDPVVRPHRCVSSSSFDHDGQGAVVAAASVAVTDSSFTATGGPSALRVDSASSPRVQANTISGTTGVLSAVGCTAASFCQQPTAYVSSPALDLGLLTRNSGRGLFARSSGYPRPMTIFRGHSLPSLGDLELPVDGYIRVSRVGDRAGESYISPDVQRHALEAWATERGVELVLHEPEENVSGGTMDRPVFNRLMDRIRSKQSGGLVVYKLDRFARTLVGGLTTLNEITECRALFASATEPLFDFTTADGRIFLQLNLMMAEYFRERTKESWASSLAFAVGRGVHIAPDVPYGYAKDEGKRLVPDARAPFVRTAFEQRVAGAPFQQIADWLNAEAPPRLDGRPWAATSVERMLRRRVYLGVAHWGEHENRAAHPALVDEALWRAAQERVQVYSKRRQADDVALLHAIVRCAGCRFQMSRALTKSGGYQRQYYRCRVYRVSGRCEAPAAVRADRSDGLEAYVEHVVRAELERRSRSYADVSDSDAFEEALDELERARDDLDTMRRDTAARRRLGGLWLSFVEPLVEAVGAAEARVEQLRTSQLPPSLHGVTADAYSSLERTERAAVLRALIDCVFVRNVGGPRGPQAVPIDERRVRILWRGQGPRDLPATNKASVIAPWRGFEHEAPTGVTPR
jgi:DNA invertase Pin-like site-specific DNA recombinase